MTTVAFTPPPFPCSIVVIKTNGNLGKTFKFERKDWCVLGANEDCDIRVPFPGVAQLQALIHVKRNGVFLQGIDKKLPVKHPRLLKQLVNEEEVLLLPGDVFLLGDRNFLIEYSPDAASNEIISASRNASKVKRSSISRSASKSRKRPTPRSRGIQKRKRKSSLVVGEFDERYVSPSGVTEKLLSKTQLARISQSETDILPGCDSVGHVVDDAPQSSIFSSSDESTVLSDHPGDVSRSIDFSAYENDLPVVELESGSNLSSRIRKDLVFARLSKGLSATPRKTEQTSCLGGTDTIVRMALSASQSEKVAMTLAGKENVPQLFSRESKSLKSQECREGTGFNRTRSPFSNRAPLENQAVPSLRPLGTPTSKNRAEAPRSTQEYTLTPRGRSVAFARAIELEAGAHYSPYRPKKVVARARNASEAGDHAHSRTAGRAQKSRGRLPVGSPSLDNEQTVLTKEYAQGPAPTSNLERLGTFFYSKKLPKHASSNDAKPVVEYEDDSNPPTPSSEDEEPESKVTVVPGPSPMARVGEALAAFLKRLSGTLESDEDDSSSGSDEAASHKRPSVTASQDTPSRRIMSSSEPVMSSSELQELSLRLSPERRKEFVDQVHDAAQDMRKAMKSIPEASSETLSPSPKETLQVEGLTKATLDTVGDGEMEPQVSTQDSGDVLTASGDSCLDSDTVDELDEDSAPSGEYKGSPHMSSSYSDSADLEIEDMFAAGMEGSDLRSEESEGEEKDYEDEDDDNSIESSDREIAAVVVDDDRDILRNFPVSSTYGAGNINRSIDDETAVQGSKRAQPRKPGDQDIPEMAPEMSATKIGSSGEEEKLSGETELLVRQPIDSLDDVIQDARKEPVVFHWTDGGYVSSEVDEAAGGSEASLGNNDTEGDARKNTQEAIRSVTSESEEKSSQFVMLRKEFSRLKKDDLKARLVELELDASGLKKDLVERLTLHKIERATPFGEEEPQMKLRAPTRQRDEVVTITMVQTAEMPGSHMTPRALRTPRNASCIDLNQQDTHTMVRRSTRKTRVQTPSNPVNAISLSVPTLQTVAEPQTVAESQTAIESQVGLDITLYRRRTVKELRHFLKTRGLDIQQKMRKEELIQHLITLSIGSDGEILAPVVVHDAAKPVEAKTPTANISQLSAAACKSHHKMTVTDLRAQLKERSQCQAGTKKILLERISSQPERRTRSRRAVDGTACSSCQAGSGCEAEGKR